MKTKKLSFSLSKRTTCPIATALDLIGDKWTLLIIRDVALFDKHRYKDFQEAGEKIPTNILATRLKMLVKAGLVEKRRYQDHPPRYAYYLTAAGEGLRNVITSMATWAATYIQGIDLAVLKDGHHSG